MKRVILTIAIIIGVCSISFPILAMQDRDEGSDKNQPAVIQQKSVEGEVAFVSNDCIAVTYARDSQQRSEEEIVFRIADLEGINLVNLKHPKKDLARGDLVRISYDERLTQTEDGNQEISLVVTAIQFMRKGAQKPQYVYPDEETDGLTSSY